MLKKNLGRFKQSISEKFGGDKTEFDAETTKLLNKSDALKSHAEHLLAGVDSFHQLASPTTNQLLASLSSGVHAAVGSGESPSEKESAIPHSLTERFGIEMTNFAQRQQITKDPYGALLCSLGKTYSSLGNEEKAIWKNAKDILAEPLRKFLHEDFENVEQERKCLSEKRLDMDTLKNKAKSSKTNEFKDELAASEQAFNDQLVKVKQMLTKVDADLVELLAKFLKDVAKAHAAHLAKCQQIFNEFSEKSA